MHAGLIWSSDGIGFSEPNVGSWGSLSLNKKAIDKIRQENLRRIERVANQYSEFYVNVGHGYMKLIEGFENLVTCKVTYAKGKGFGSKARHMKKWIFSRVQSKFLFPCMNR